MVSGGSVRRLRGEGHGTNGSRREMCVRGSNRARKQAVEKRYAVYAKATL